MEKDNIIRIENYSDLKELHNKIIELINAYRISAYNAIGVLEMIKQEIFQQSEEGANSPFSS